MKHSNFKHITIIIFCMGILNGCSSTPSVSQLKSAHKEIDLNKDGFIDYKEYRIEVADENISKEAKAKGLTEEQYHIQEYNLADTNRDGKVTVQEFINFVKNNSD